MSNVVGPVYKFNSFLLDERERRFSCDGKQISLTPKAFDTLLLLVKHAGHVLEKQELMAQIWPEVFVEEATLAQNIFTLRRSLGEGSVQYIETVPRKGYRFIAKVEILEQTNIVSATESVGKKTLPVIAVLPFEIFNSNDEIEYLSIGLADALITKLSNLTQIIVRPTSSIKKYAVETVDPLQAGKELQADCVLTGSFQRVANRVRANVQFVSVTEGAVLWSEKIDDAFVDIFSVQDAIAEQVMQTFLLTLTQQEKSQLAKRLTQDQNAYLQYLKGAYHWNKWTKDGFEKGIAYFRQAIQIDPDFAFAWAGLSQAYSALAFYSFLAPQIAFHESGIAAQRALQIDPTLAEANQAQAFVDFFHNWHWANAERGFVKALGLSPRNALLHHGYGSFLLALGRFEEATTELQYAHNLDPLSPLIHTTLGYPYYFSGQPEQALTAYQKALEQDGHFPLAHKALGDAYLEIGEYEKGIAAYLQSAKLAGRHPGLLSYLAYAYGLAGQPDEAQKILTEVEMLARHLYISPTARSIIHLGLHEDDRALDYLEAAYRERCNNLVYLKVQPTFDRLRSSPRFTDLLAKMAFE